MRAFFSFFLARLREKREALLLIALSAGIFGAVFALYKIPVGAAVYPALLCIAALTVYTVIDSVGAYRKHLTLSGLASLPDGLCELLRRFDSQDDRDYREIISALSEKLAALRTEALARESDMTDYYTRWVHQIKLPIASMRLTLEREDSPVARSLSDDLFRIEQYVDMALTYLRLDSESTDYVFCEQSLDDVVKRSVRKFAAQFIGRGIRLDYTPTGKRVTTDEKWLGFVIEQLLSNALKYTQRGSVAIFAEESPPGFSLVIRDTGIGIAAEDIPRVFERGYTGCNGRSGQSSSGLGLWLCKRVCGNLGCGVSISSEVGRGTAVRLTFDGSERRFE